MDARIAVLLDENSNVAGPGGCAMLAVFEKIGGAWTVVREIPADIRLDGGLYAARNEILSLAESLDGCRIIAGQKFSGIFFNTLDRLGFFIFEIKAVSPDVLDAVLTDVGEAKAKKPPDAPVKTGERGRWFLDLTELQRNDPGMSSKKALRPILGEPSFVELTLICSHVPPWLENDPGLSVAASPHGEGVRAVVTRKP